MIKLQYLDHVAINVADMEKSARWYEKVLGLKRYTFEEWGDFPIFMLSGKSGVAIFPAKSDERMSSRGIKIDHFAFNVDQENFEKAKSHYEDLGIEYRFADHHFFHSIYITDPDGHTVELTTLVVDEKSFFR